jgi:flagellin-like hook-associated protein FlgL
MTNSIIGIPTSRLSDTFVRDQLLNQLQINQEMLFRTQTQLSTGHRFESISDDPVSALNVASLKSLLERKAQIQKNIDTNQSYLSTTDSVLSSVSDLLIEARGTALGVIGDTATDVQRSAASQQIEQTLQQLMNIGNQQFRGRYLFAGSENAAAPFSSVGNAIQYSGNEQRLSSYDDLNMLFDTNVNGNEVFGAISSAVQGTATITPALTYDTRLADLRQGQGISKGSILVSDGVNSSTIDISGAETIGDLATIIHAHPPAGRELMVDITADKIIVQLDPAGGGSLSIREVGGGTVADELGIRRDNGVGTNPINGRALQPALAKTTVLQNILGTYANTTVHSTGRDNDIRLQADTMGAATSTGVALGGVQITLVNDPAIIYGHETVDFDPVAHTITVHIDEGATRAYHVVDAINNAQAAGDLPFTAEIDPIDDVNGGQGLVEANATARTRDGSGQALDQQSGLRITNGEQEFNIDNLSTCRTVEDLLNAVNKNAGLLAEINSAKDGIDIRSRMSGADFTIGENGGATAAQLGLRSFSEDTSLEQLNFNRGVNESPDSGTTGGIDFTIVRTDGAELKIDIAGAETIGDVLNLINNNANNADGKLVARLAVHGNGIELVDNSGGAGDLKVVTDVSSSAAVDLGLIPAGAAQSDPGTVNYNARLTSVAPNSGLIFTAKDPGIDMSGVRIVFDGAATGVTYDGSRLTIGIVPGMTTANDVVEAVSRSSAASLFHVELDPTGGHPNDGTGKVDEMSALMTEAKTLDGRDVNQKETVGVFTALSRLEKALQSNDLPEIKRAMGLLDQSTQNLNFTHAELGTRQQGLDVMKDRLGNENIELQKVLSNDYDADMSVIVSNLAGQQVALEASLRATGSILQMTLLDYL